MPIFRRFVDEFSGFVPSVLRRMGLVVVDEDGTETSKNILNLAVIAALKLFDAEGEAIEEFADTGWPLTTAGGWVLDEHWGPFHGLQRNGQSDADYRLYIQAKRLLNRSWGSADQALEIFALLLPGAVLSFTPSYPKHWAITIGGVSMAAAAPAVLFMTKKPSPQGGGFSVCGDNGTAVISDPEVLSFSSVYGVIGVDYEVTGWYGSVYGPDPGGGVYAGWAHVAGI